MKTLRQEDGRQLETAGRKWIYMPTTSFPRAFMCHLIRVSYVVASAHFNDCSPVAHCTWKQRGSLFWTVVALVYSECRVLPQNRQLTVSQRRTLRGPACIYSTAFPNIFKALVLSMVKNRAYFLVLIEMCLYQKLDYQDISYLNSPNLDSNEAFSTNLSTLYMLLSELKHNTQCKHQNPLVKTLVPRCYKW